MFASELRIRDIAELQSILDDEWADPMDSVRDVLADAGDDGKGQFMRLAPLYERAEVGPPVYGTTRGHEFYGSPEGGALLLWVACRWNTEGLTPALAAILYSRATPDEYMKVWRIAHGVSSLKALENLLWGCLPGGHGLAPDSGTPATWAEMIDGLSQLKPGWTYEQIADLTLNQWIYARNGGKVPETTRRAGPGQDAAELAKLQREWWKEARARESEGGQQ